MVDESCLILPLSQANVERGLGSATLLRVAGFPEFEVFVSGSEGRMTDSDSPWIGAARSASVYAQGSGISGLLVIKCFFDGVLARSFLESKVVRKIAARSPRAARLHPVVILCQMTFACRAFQRAV